ncbi:hypothetical protein LWC08_03140 [Desulfobaculum bizertense]|uniref:hypothetical protein n=1 Tax=Desulfobaculum bizertense TaxID=376490 RepID=UPI001F3D554A|nr:hypothetical protein [Desulfobaculum bizertense]UIJ38579.1 hypothetical protein LWC08_03140 [Desulfobaculum bizertense]
MLDKVTFLKELTRQIDKLPVGHCVDTRSYKRDRSVLFIRVDSKRIRIVENGFEQRDLVVNEGAELRKQIKRVSRVEFPRSHKIRLYNLGEFTEDEHCSMRRKKL